MPPNRHLSDIVVTGRPSLSDYRVLTPRTPHSRAGRAEEGFTEVELQTFQDDESNDWSTQQQEQSQPLLSSGYRSRGDDVPPVKDAKSRRSFKYWIQHVVNMLPLAGGSFVAFLLLAFIVISITKPGKLESAFLSVPGSFMETTNPNMVATTSKQPTASASVSQPAPSTSASGHSQPHPQLISYENYTSFPLTGNEYRAECNKLMGGFMSHGEYWEIRHGGMDVEHHDDTTNYHLPEGELTKVCSKTVTYLLDGHVGLVADLALMAQAAAFAHERNLTFLIDDTHWNRGKWTDYFQPVRFLDPGPEPGCRAPPPEELVACPRTARHWVISSSTAMYHLGHAFSEGYEDGFGHHMNRLKPIYERARTAFQETIRPNAHTAELIRAARTELFSTLSSPPASPNLGSQDGPAHPPAGTRGRDVISDDSSYSPRSNNPAPYVGVHIRKGDRHPAAISFYRDGTIPLAKYAIGARQAWAKFYGDSSSEPEGVDMSSDQEGRYPAPPVMWLASDSPAAVREFEGSFSAATAVFSLNRSANAGVRALAPVREYVQAEFEQEELAERMRLTRGMVVDLAMVSGLWAYPGEVVPGAVVCAEGSNVCRVSALGFGFERAFGFDDGDHYSGDPDPARARWVDVDVEGRIVPAWHAFELH